MTAALAQANPVRHPELFVSYTGVARTRDRSATWIGLSLAEALTRTLRDLRRHRTEVRAQATGCDDVALVRCALGEAPLPLAFITGATEAELTAALSQKD